MAGNYAPLESAGEFVCECLRDGDRVFPKWGNEVCERIVRCKDCEYANHYHPLDFRTGRPHETLEEWYCTWHSNAEGASEIEPDGFCAWGVRKED